MVTTLELRIDTPRIPEPPESLAAKETAINWLVNQLRDRSGKEMVEIIESLQNHAQPHVVTFDGCPPQ